MPKKKADFANLEKRITSLAIRGRANVPKIVDVADGFIQDYVGGDYTVTTYHALEVFVPMAMDNPSLFYYPEEGESYIRHVMSQRAEELEADPIGSIIISEYWMFESLIHFDLIGYVCMIVARAVADGGVI
ncbi:MAG: hypothetical protein E7Z63_01040 [Thermoplasmata archaeon]|nr:hypothetical protein [Thermoplasmata archaeon]